MQRRLAPLLLVCAATVVAGACDGSSPQKPAPSPQPSPAVAPAIGTAGRAPRTEATDAPAISSGTAAAPDLPPASPMPSPSPDGEHAGPPDATLDDEAILTLVVAKAERALPWPEFAAVLPRRVSPVRVAVRALHDHLLGVPQSARSLPRLLDALDTLAALDSVAAPTDAQRLGTLVAAWKKWTPAEIEDERELALRCARALDFLRDPKQVKTEVLAAALRGAAKPPPQSPGGAGLAALGAVHAAISDTSGGLPGNVVTGLDEATKAFDALGWPGGLGVWLEIGVARLESGGSPSIVSSLLTEHARSAFQRSGDVVRAAQVTADRAQRVLAETPRMEPTKAHSETDRAQKLLGLAIDELANAGCRGRELSDTLFLRAGAMQAVGRHRDALPIFDRCAAEIRHTATDLATLAPLEERRATSCFRLARWDEALAAADAGAAAYDAHVRGADPNRESLRASLDELAGESLAEWGRGAEGAQRYLAAAGRIAKLPGGDGRALRDRVLAAISFARGGDATNARAIVDPLVSSKASLPELRIAAARVYRTLGDVKTARREFDLAGSGLSDVQRASLAVEAARLLAAEGRTADALAAFLAVESRLQAGDPQRPAGPEAAEACLEAARLEAGRGAHERAVQLADRSFLHLSTGTFEREVDDAYEVIVASHKRRGWFVAAEKAASRRVKLEVGTKERRDLARLELGLLRMDLADGGDAAAAKSLQESAPSIPYGVGGTLCRLTGGDAPDGAMPAAPPADAPFAVHRIHQAAVTTWQHNSAGDYVRLAMRDTDQRCPEIMRWLLRRAVVAPETKKDLLDPVLWTSLWLGAKTGKGAQARWPTERDLDAVLGKDEWFSITVPIGRETVGFLTEGPKLTMKIRTEGCAGLNGLWDAVHVDSDGLRAVAAEVTRPWRGGVPPVPKPRAAIPVTVLLGPPIGPLPIGLLEAPAARPSDPDARLDMSEFHVLSPAERIERATAVQPAEPAFLRSADEPFEGRWAIAILGTVPDSVVAKVRTAFLARIAAGDSPVAALDAACAPDPTRDDPKDAIPLRARFLFRGVR